MPTGSVRLTAVLFCASMILAACGGSNAPTQPGAADVTINLTTNPDPPESGQLELVVTLTDTAGQPIDDAAVNLLASHATMSGMDMQGAATSQGNGRYAITADFVASGEWLVTVEVRIHGSEAIRKDFNLTLK